MKVATEACRFLAGTLQYLQQVVATSLGLASNFTMMLKFMLLLQLKDPLILIQMVLPYLWLFDFLSFQQKLRHFRLLTVEIYRHGFQDD
jgi:hypothetical protein